MADFLSRVLDQVEDLSPAFRTPAPTEALPDIVGMLILSSHRALHGDPEWDDLVTILTGAHFFLDHVHPGMDSEDRLAELEGYLDEGMFSAQATPGMPVEEPLLLALRAALDGTFGDLRDKVDAMERITSEVGTALALLHQRSVI